MTTTIYKYPVPPQDADIVLDLPTGAQVLHVAVQNDMPCVWALIDTDLVAAPKPRRFRWHGTGHPIDPDLGARHYIGTVHLRTLVFHLFEVTS